MPPIQPTCPVAVTVPHAYTHYRNIVRGVAHTARKLNIPVRYYEGFHDGTMLPDSSGKAKIAGVVGAFGDGKFQQLRLAGIPAVQISGRSAAPPRPHVLIDDHAVGRLACDHLADCGFRHFAVVSLGDAGFSCRRAAAFETALRERLGDSACLHRAQPDAGGESDLSPWLRTLPKPLGIFAVNDIRALRVLEACQTAGIQVPRDVAVVGVDNEDPLCDMCVPPLSSIATNGERLGAEALSLLLRLINGTSAGDESILVPPAGVILRQSSDVCASQDQEVRAAAEYIRLNLHRPIGVDDLVRMLPTTRRTLERRFRAARGRSPAAEIRRAKVQRARELLFNPALSLPEVAAAVGFAYARHLTLIFRQETGMTPTAFRRSLR